MPKIDAIPVLQEHQKSLKEESKEYKAIDILIADNFRLQDLYMTKIREDKKKK